MLVTIQQTPVFALYHASSEDSAEVTEIYNADSANDAYRAACRIAREATRFGPLRSLVVAPYQDHPEHPGEGRFAVFPPGAWPKIETSDAEYGGGMQ